MKTTLCIIDLQPRFNTATPDVIDEAVRQIHLAKRRKDGIVILEYGDFDESPDYERSYPAIYDALGRYDKVAIKDKYDDSGADELLCAINDHSFSMERLRVVGVNTCACVWATLEDVMWHGFFDRIELIQNGLNCMHSVHRGCFDQLQEKVWDYYVAKRRNCSGEN
jgi:hypothetical protein